ncbi:MAG: lamin tail domain-containing protein [Myxococcota bacterium]
MRISYVFWALALVACGGGPRTNGVTPDNGGGRVSCVVRAQCIGGDCINGTCTAGSRGGAGAGCTTPIDCDSGVCSGGFCATPPDSCNADNECPLGAYCHFASGDNVTQGICDAPCRGVSDCYRGQECFGGRCYTLNDCAASGSEACAPEEICDPATNTCRWPINRDVERCTLVGASSITAEASEPLEFRGRLFQPGVTDASNRTDPDPTVQAEWGFGPAGSMPGSDWTWVGGSASASWVDSRAPDEDEYAAFPNAPASGNYSFAFRFSVDGGVTFTACDFDGSDNGFQSQEAGALFTTSSACDPNPCFSPPRDECGDDGVTLFTYDAPGDCAIVGSQASCDYEAKSFDCSSLGGFCVAGDCANEAGAPFSPGTVLVTEFMPQSTTGTDNGEWVELTNVSFSSTFNLEGCELADDGGDSHFINDVLVVDPGQSVVLARSMDPAENFGLPADYSYVGFQLANSSDEIVLRCGGSVIDRVAYDSWSFALGVSAQLDVDLFAVDEAGNDLESAFCPSTGGYGTGGKLGTPGSANRDCDGGSSDPCDPNPCNSPPGPRCNGNLLEFLADPGSCTVVGQAPICEYPVANVVDCGASGGTCQAGECVIPTDPTGLAFNEYIEGNGSNKAIEIVNDGASTSLSGCELQVYFNGQSTPSTVVTLSSAFLGFGDTFVLCDNDAFDSFTRGSLCDQVTGSPLWNGNDAIVLRCGGQVVDSFGKLGEDPGAGGWDGITANMTLRRICGSDVDTNPLDPFTALLDWASTSIDDTSGLGSGACEN